MWDGFPGSLTHPSSSLCGATSCGRWPAGCGSDGRGVVPKEGRPYRRYRALTQESDLARGITLEGVSMFPRGTAEDPLRMWIDSDWVGNLASWKSCSSEHIRRNWGGMCRRSKIQSSVARSWKESALQVPSGSSSGEPEHESQRGCESMEKDVAPDRCWGVAALLHEAALGTKCHPELRRESAQGASR